MSSKKSWKSWMKKTFTFSSRIRSKDEPFERITSPYYDPSTRQYEEYSRKQDDSESESDEEWPEVKWEAEYDENEHVYQGHGKEYGGRVKPASETEEEEEKKKAPEESAYNTYWGNQQATYYGNWEDHHQHGQTQYSSYSQWEENFAHEYNQHMKIGSPENSDYEY